MRWVVLLLLVVASMAPVLGQVSGRAAGSVLDGTGASIPNAKVSMLIETTVVATTTTNASGLFAFTGLRPATYDIRVEAAGFTAGILKQVVVETARETAVAPITLSPAGVTETVEVSASATTVQTTNAEVSSTVTNAQVARLPQLNRSPLALITTQAGVGSNGRTNTTINGLRTSFTNITVDGVNIQDNFLRSNALDFLPNLLLLDQIAEMTVSTANTNATVGGGAAQVSFTTPSGTNEYHGAVYWYNRNNATAANSWFNNRDGIGLPFLNQNQVGGKVSGPIKKNKLFFYGNYEAFRLRQQTTLNRTVLTGDARNGIMSYTAGGSLQKVNLLSLTGRSMDSAMKDLIGELPAASAINNYRVGDSTEGTLRNTAGYTFLARSNRTRDNVTAKLDYVVSPTLNAYGTILWNRDILDRPGISANTFAAVPFVTNNNATPLGSFGIRWTPTATLTNEVRAGYNLAPAKFDSSAQNPSYLVGGLIFSNPRETFLPQGRFTDTYNFADNANWMKGKHQISFGFQAQLTRIYTYNDAGIVPTYNLGIGAGQTGASLTSAQLPGISSTDLTTANNLLANLTGLLNTATATYNVKDRNSGFVLGQTNGRNLTFDTYSGYVQDNWKVARNFTVQAGIRYELFTRVNERDALSLTPVLIENNPIKTLMSNATLDFGGTSVDRPYYKKDLNNFAPNLGMAWTPFKDGKTVLRAGYSLNFVNDGHIAAVNNAVVSTNSGLQQAIQVTGLSGTLSANRPTLPVPTFMVPRTQRDNYNLNSGAAMAIVNPELATPYVQQWNFSIQREAFGGVFDVRYVGNRGTKLFRGFDYNQVNINANGFLDDFRRAYANGIAAQNATGNFDPRYNANIPGSQQLTVFPLLGSGGALTNATVLANIQQQRVGQLASWYQENALAGPRSTSALGFYNNPFGLGMNMTNNYSNSSYNAAQIDYARRYSKGLFFQLNYTYSKVMSDTAGDGQTSFEAFLDINNGKIEKSRTPFDQTHSLKGNAIYDLPFGKGMKFLSSAPTVVNYVVGGWSVSGIYTLASGNPFSILTERGTLNRDARSTGQNGNTATTLLNKSELDDIFQLRMTGNGPYFVAASAIGPDGRGVAADGKAPFAGQVFYNPGMATIGALQRRYFSGPTWWNLDFGVQKKILIGERQSVEVRMESTNFFNHATFYMADDNINSATFGRVNNTQTASRRFQFGLYYRF
jgi:hypothetical protein